MNIDKDVSIFRSNGDRVNRSFSNDFFHVRLELADHCFHFVRHKAVMRERMEARRNFIRTIDTTVFFPGSAFSVNLVREKREVRLEVCSLVNMCRQMVPRIDIPE